MKKVLALCSLLFVASNYSAQTTLTENFVYSKTCLDADCIKKAETVQYFDGLGRPKQVVNVKASPLGKDVVTSIVYDQFGRQTKDYLPVPQSGSNNGGIYAAPLANATVIYGAEKIYAEKILEASPLDRIQQQIQVGNAWATHPVVFGYDSNTASEVKKYVITTSWINGATSSVLTTTGNFGANQLYKNSVTDEDGNISIEFKNGQGQTLLVRKKDGSQNIDTYYVYNEYDQLALVIPPLAAVKTTLSTTDLDQLCYQYRYDGRNRLVEKKLPGKGWEWMVYDKADRLAATKDAQNLWIFTKYDQFNRVVYTGLANLGTNRTTVQTNYDNHPSLDELRSGGSFNHSNMDVDYTNRAYPMSFSKLLSVNYYDTYPTLPSSVSYPPYIINSTQTTLGQDAQNSAISTKSLPTASYVKNIEDDNWTKAYTWYDTKGRPIGSHSLNHLGGFTKTESELDFAGVVQKSFTYHSRASSTTEVTIEENFEYDDQNRLLTHKHKVNGGNEETLTQNTYNELSQLESKKVGNTVASPLQQVDYTYNIRGWMTGINPDALDDIGASGKLFAYGIKYTEDNSNVFPKRYNGNIAEVDWVNSFGPQMRKRYSYNYDNINRLTDAYFANPGTTLPLNHNNDEVISYDVNGNIINLKRNAVPFFGATADQIDDLNYIYDGNRLISIDDVKDNPTGYEGGANTINYDTNGNMTNMLDKNIQQIGYNFLNLPNAFSINNQTRQQIFLYRADGTKLRKIYNATNSNNETFASITEYIDGFHYLTTQGTPFYDALDPMEFAYEQEAFIYEILQIEPVAALKFFPTAEGFYDFENNEYIYQYKDHLGNVRISYKKDGNYVETTDQNDYYPFGMNIPREEESIVGTASLYNYKYNGKELQETGMYDYGARFYMADIARWGVVDPLAEKMPSWSPYVYTFNNPINYTDPTGMEPYNEYDKNGKMISNLGGNKVDFFHQKNGDTQVVNRESGASNVIKGGESIIRGYAHRGKDVGWGTITNEYINGTGPTRSLFSDFNNSNNGPFASLDKTSSPYSSLARQDALNSENSKGVIKMDYLHANPFRANVDGFEQMWGRSNVSWYKLGDETLFLMTDSKSQQSLFYRIPSIDNFERSSNFKFNGLGNTYQTYMWTESNSEVQQKVYNQFDSKKNQPINNATRQQINDYIKNGGAP